MSLDTGYELHRMETYNWGNFHNLHRIEISKSPDLVGPLGFFGAKKAAVFAGVNGAGKTTLIDPIFCILMPFQNRISLGVIADAEKSGRKSGGRSIADYVLGKHSSSDEENASSPERYYSRKTGVSVVLLVFRHRQSGKMISLARLWWYSDYRVKEDQGFVIVRGEASIQDSNVINLLKEDGTFFESASSFRKGMKAKGRSVDPLNTPTEFLHAASGLLNYTAEDIILLNKAFNIKSIANIDTFVRENMLLEVTKESVDRLCNNIQRASEIFRMINNEQLKLDTAEKILGHLGEAKTQYENQFLHKVEIQLADLVTTYREQNTAEESRTNLEKERNQLELDIPKLEASAKKLAEDLDEVRTQLSSAPTAEKLRALESRESRLKDRIESLKTNRAEVERVCKNLGLAAPKKPSDEKAFKESLDVKIEALRLQYESATNRIQQLGSDRGLNESEKTKVKTELDHYSRHATLIPDHLYAEKLRCIHELNLDPRDLMFVGELIEVPEKHQKYRRAAESVLRPISRNLLCHPRALSAVENWINSNRLNSDLTVKRITSTELSDPPRTVIPGDSVLNYIAIKPEKDNRFYSYVARWIRANFWHKVISVSDLKSDVEKAVTLEGLVKSDTRTMTKYRDRFGFSLGWDNRVLCLELRAKLAEIEKVLASIGQEEQAAQKNKDSAWGFFTIATQLRATPTDHLNISEIELERTAVASDIKRLKKDNPDHDLLLEQEKEFKADYEAARDSIASARNDVKHFSVRLAELENTVSAKSQYLQDAVTKEFGGRKMTLLEHFGSMQPLLSRIETIDSELRSKGLTPHAYKTNREKSTPSPQQAISAASVAMDEFKRLFNDPDLVYKSPGSENDVQKLADQWSQVAERVKSEGLPGALVQFQEFYTETLFDSTKAAISDINEEKHRIERDTNAINETLKLNNFERLPDGDERFLQIVHEPSKDEQIKAFDRELKKVQATISAEVRVLPPRERAEKIMATLEPFVKTLEDAKYRQKVVDARNHYSFKVKSYKRGAEDAPAEEKETFRGAGSDGKSGGQTAQLCYALLAASIACRFHFYDPVRGRDTLRVFLVDEFTGKFDNEKPQDVMHLLSSMGFQAIVLTPMSKLETLRGFTNRVVFVHKRSAMHSVANSIEIISDEEKSLIDLIATSGPLKAMVEAATAETN